VRIRDAELSGSTLLATLDGLDSDRLRTMARASAAAGIRDAARRVLAVLREVARR
jgi:UDP-N-acetylglucosamine:LPS N-acetylglucosamine transferase